MDDSAEDAGAGVVEALLRDLGVDPAALLGFGGEARVWALGDDRVVRVCHPGTPAAAVHQRIELVAELSAGDPPFVLPEVLDVQERHGRLLTIERRLDGIPLAEALADATGPARSRLIEAHLDAAAALADLALRPRPWFGQLIGDDPVRSPTWPTFLARRAEASLTASGLVDDRTADSLAVRLAADLVDAGSTGRDRCFVHLDAFAGNILVAGGRVTAVIDFGPTSLAGGDRGFDPVACAVYLGSPTITPTATAADVAVARAWLRDRGLAERHEPMRRWLAAFWSFAVDDAKLHAWCRSVLGEKLSS